MRKTKTMSLKNLEVLDSNLVKLFQSAKTIEDREAVKEVISIVEDMMEELEAANG